MYKENASDPSPSTAPESDELASQYDAGAATEFDLDVEQNFSDLYLINVSLFYLELQRHFFLPA